MSKTLEKRLLMIRRSVEGMRERTQYEHTFHLSYEELSNIVPVNLWHRRILSELDFCLQMKKYAGTDVDEPVDAALTILEQAQERNGALPDDVCKEAEQCLLPLAREARSYKLLLIGHAHLDMNWQWGMDETAATVTATFRTMLRLMEEYPQFCFSQSQASTYKLIEDYAPEMKPEIQKRIQEGRWEVTASAWVETDKNMPCLESLMNHIVYTKQYLKEHWDIAPESLNIDFSPDTFGHSAFLPEVDLLGGVKYYYHCRGYQDPDKVLYRWKAPSGKELLMYKEPYWYISMISPLPAIGLPRMASMCGGLRTGMAVYGVGDHGGGPTRRDLSHALEMQQWPVFPQLCFGRFKDYFEEAEKVRDKLPVVERELNPVFTGCYTTQSRIKKGNRRAENALLNAEKLSALVSDKFGTPYAVRAFEKAWQDTLFTHFHDILTGSCVQDSREYAMGLFQESLTIANCRSVQAIEKLTSSIDTSALAEGKEDRSSISEGAGVGFGLMQGNIPTHENGAGMTRIFHIINTTGVERHENARLVIWDWPGNLELIKITDASGEVLPFERTTGWQSYWQHRFFEILVTVTVPANGYTTVVLKENDPEDVSDCYIYTNAFERQHEAFADTVLENKYLCACFDRRTGELYSLVDKATGKECLMEGETGGLRYIKAQKHGMSSWVIDRYLEERKLTDTVRIIPLPGTLNPGLQIEQRVANSSIVTKVTLGSEDRFLTVSVHVDWKEESKGKDEQPLLSYCLPVAESTGRMLCDVPGGALWRPDQEIDMPCLRYAAAEMNNGRVLALASDCKYGFRLSRGVLYVSLINTADEPDPYPERGIQDIKLFVFPAEADAAEMAHKTDICLNPLQYVTNTAHEGGLPVTGSLLQIEGDSVVVTGVAKRDGCLTVRMYEARGVECAVVAHFTHAVLSAQLTDLFGHVLPILVKVEGDTVRFTLAPYTQVELRV